MRALRSVSFHLNTHLCAKSRARKGSIVFKHRTRGCSLHIRHVMVFYTEFVSYSHVLCVARIVGSAASMEPVRVLMAGYLHITCLANSPVFHPVTLEKLFCRGSPIWLEMHHGPQHGQQ